MLTLKNLKISRSQSEETMAYTADVFWEGRCLGHIRNDGGGGMSHLALSQSYSRADLDAATALATSQEQDLGEAYGKVPFGLLEDYVDHLAWHEGERQDAKRWLTRTMKAKVALVDAGQVYTLPAKWEGNEDRVRALLAQKYPQATVLNALPLEQAIDRYLACVK